MPRGDGTGPMGFGPMSGRAMGYCAGFNVPGYLNPNLGRFGLERGLGRGRWFGSGCNRAPYLGAAYGYGPYLGVSPQISKEDEISLLKQQAEYFKQAMDDINNRLSVLEK